MPNTNNDIYSMFNDFLSDLEKSASEVNNLTDDREKAVSTGERASENTADVKDSIPSSVDETPEDKANSTGGLNNPVYRTGLKADETGVNVPSTKANKKDPGTAHPAKAGTEKYASVHDLIDAYADILAETTILAKAAADSKAQAGTNQTADDSELDENIPVTETADQAKAGPNSTSEKPAVVKQANAQGKYELTAEEYEQLTKTAEAFDELVGVITGSFDANSMLEEDNQVVNSQENQEFTPEMAKQAEAVIYDIANRAQHLGVEVANFMSAFEKKAEGLPIGVDPGLAGDPLLGAGGDPALEAGLGGEEEDLSPEEIELLLSALQQEGLTEDDLAGIMDEVGGELGGDVVDDPEMVESADDAALTGLSEDSSSEGEEEDVEKSAAYREKVTKLASMMKKAAMARNKKNTGKTGNAGKTGKAKA